MTLSSLEGENHIGNASVHAIASSSFLSINVSSFSRLIVFHNEAGHDRFYQEIAKSLTMTYSANETVSKVTTRLVSLADSAQVIREFDIVDRLARLIFSLPVSAQLENVGRYYQALSLSRSAGGDIARAGSLFEEVAEVASSQYRAKAMLALGTNSVAVGDSKTAATFYQEVTRILKRDRVFDPMTLYTAARMTAVMKSLEGDHRGALADLENMFPLVRMASARQPYSYYDYLNALAVELTGAGRLDEARNASRITLASPYAAAYPEWRETFDEIEHRRHRASRSTVAVTQRALNDKNLVMLRRPQRSSAVTAWKEESQPLARVLLFPTKLPRGTLSKPEQNERRPGSEPFDKRRIVSDKLYEMFMSALEDGPVNLDLVEELYKTFIKKRKQS